MTVQINHIPPCLQQFIKFTIDTFRLKNKTHIIHCKPWIRDCPTAMFRMHGEQASGNSGKFNRFRNCLLSRFASITFYEDGLSFISIYNIYLRRVSYTYLCIYVCEWVYVCLIVACGCQCVSL